MSGCGAMGARGRAGGARGARGAGRALLLLLLGAAAAVEGPRCRPGTDCVLVKYSSNEYFFKVNGRTLNVIYDESASALSVRCDEGDDDEPGPAAAADERALPALPALAELAVAEFQGCRLPAAPYAEALRALNVSRAAALRLERLPAAPPLAPALLAGLGALEELKLGAARPPAPPLRPPPDFLAELPRLRALRLHRVEAARALPRLPAALRWLELKEAGLAAAEREAPAPPHWLRRLRELRRLTVIEQYGEGRLTPPPLAALPLLREASLTAPLARLPDRWLAGSALERLFLVSCGISDLSGLPFEGKNLTKLNISQNNLTDLPRGVFAATPALQLLDVSHNGLPRAALERALPPLAALRELDAGHNPLGSLCNSASIGHGRAFSELPGGLRALGLRATGATRLCSDWLERAPDLALIDLRDNRIESLDNEDLQLRRRRALAAAGVRLLLAGNPLRDLPGAGACPAPPPASTGPNDTTPQLARVELSLPALGCSCAAAPLRALLRGCSRLALAEDVPCINDTRTFLQYDPDELLCDYELECIPGCSCGAWRLRDNATVVECAGAAPGALARWAGWPGWPGWAAASRARPLALRAPGAALAAVPRAALVQLLAPNNAIAALDEDDIPETLRELDLRNNSIARVSAAAAARLRGVGVSVRLAGNPFRCACQDEPALARLRDANVTDWDELRCGAGPLRGRLLRGVRAGELCGDALPWALGGALAALALLAGGAALWPRLRPRLKQFLFERRLCQDWVLGADDEVDDPAKTHDAFVSYAYQDLALALRVVRGLEARGYSTVEHCRDWAPGPAVAEHIARSVLAARRTLLLVSDHYGASRWALQEFRAAHAHALGSRAARLLLLRAGLRAPQRLPPDLQLHLRLNTYLDLDDPAFWRKLCSAMPRPRAPAPADPAPRDKQPRLWTPSELDRPHLWTPPAPRATPLAGKPPRPLTPPAPRAPPAAAAERLRRLLSPAPEPPPAPAPGAEKLSFAAQAPPAPRAAPAC